MTYDNRIWVFDDIIDKSLQDKIKDTLIGNNRIFPWFFLEDITGKDQKRTGFQHQLIYQEKEQSEYITLVHPIVTNSLIKIFYPLDKIINARTFLQLPLNLNNYDVDTPHVDMEKKHLVVLYYVMDSDGDTIIYNEKEKSEKYTIQQKVSPRQGRVVVFDGSFYHTAEQPKQNNRCVINFNII
jgi:hypothetical protein